jgi:hypothetical protein
VERSLNLLNIPEVSFSRYCRRWIRNQSMNGRRWDERVMIVLDEEGYLQSNIPALA